MSDAETTQVLERLKAAANAEAAPADLAERVVANLEYRTRLEAPFIAQARSRRRRLVAAAGFALSAAASIWVLVRGPQSTSRIAAERPPPSAAGPAAAAPKATIAAPDPCRERLAATGDAPLFDDFEDGDDALAPLEQRAGFWRWARESDAPGTAPALIPVPRVDSSSRSKLALHVKGGRLFDWGATVEVNFRPSCYDVSSYAGIKLQARGPGRVYLALREVGVIPIAEGGSCEHDCHNPHVVKIDLSSEWHSYEFRWADLRRRGIDMPPLDTTRLHSLALLIRPEDTPYDVWIDEIRFVPKGS
jgi:hypothetical protein